MNRRRGIPRLRLVAKIELTMFTGAPGSRFFVVVCGADLRRRNESMSEGDSNAINSEKNSAHRIEESLLLSSEAALFVDGQPVELEDETWDAEVLIGQMLADPSLVQYVTRHHQDGLDSIAGYFRCQIEANQQRYILHVPFYPHFTRIPQVTASLTADREGRVRITDQQRFGTRIEVVLDQPAVNLQWIMVEVFASAPLDK